MPGPRAYFKATLGIYRPTDITIFVMCVVKVNLSINSTHMENTYIGPTIKIDNLSFFI